MFHALIWCLRLVTVTQCIGLAGCYVLATAERESEIYGWLFFDLGWSESWSQGLDDFGSYACLIGAMVLLISGLLGSLALGVPRKRRQRWQSWLELPVLIFVSLWCLLLALTETLRGGLFTEWAIAEQAVRYATPVALGWLLISQARGLSQQAIKRVTLLLLLAAFSTFLVHGFKAVLAYGPFVDLLLLSEQRWLEQGMEQGMEQATAETLLVFIGWLDIGLAIGLLLTRWRIIACYMAFWGFLTAASRVTAFGAEAWPEMLVRAANGGALMALVFCFSLLRKVD